MTAIHIHRQLMSDTLPELRPWIGKTVDIVVREANVPAVIPGTGDWSAREKAVHPREEWDAALADLADLDIDWDAYKRQREYDLQHANDHLP